MSVKNVMLCCFIAICLAACAGGDKSRVLYFTYSGYGDNNYASIEGNVYEIKGKDTVALPGVLIKSDKSKVKSPITDRIGFFSAEFEKGKFDVMISKPDYQSIKITDYISDPDQVTLTRIILAKGTGVQTFKAPAWKK